MTVSLFLVINPWVSSDEHPTLFSAQCRNLHFWLLAYCNCIALVTVIQEWRNQIKENEMQGEFLEPLKERHGSYILDFFFFKIFWCEPFLKSLLDLLQHCFCIMFWFFCPKAHGILTPWPWIKPTVPALESEVLTTGPLGKCLSPWSYEYWGVCKSKAMGGYRKSLKPNLREKPSPDECVLGSNVTKTCSTCFWYLTQ